MKNAKSIKTVLIVDDEPTIRLTLRATLEAVDYRVIEAGDGGHALDLLAYETPAAVLLDLSMPRVNGLTFLRRLGELPAGRRPPVVVLTAYGSLPVAVEAMKIGARDFIEKPATPDEIRAVLASVIAHDAPAEAETPADQGADYETSLTLVRDALRAGRIRSAEQLLIRVGAITPHNDASFLNLAGVLHEASGRRDAARRFYGRAIRADSAHGPAQQNMRRMYELTTIGNSREPVALGDELKFLLHPPPAPYTPPQLLHRLRCLLSGLPLEGDPTSQKDP